jgi:hypothetical protein
LIHAVDVKPESHRTIELRSFLAHETTGKSRVPWMALTFTVLALCAAAALVASGLAR